MFIGYFVYLCYFNYREFYNFFLTSVLVATGTDVLCTESEATGTDVSHLYSEMNVGFKLLFSGCPIIH